jgi:carbonic anhydrase
MSGTKSNHIFERNRAWAQSMRSERPDFFTRLMAQQSPQYMWIGCSDSRVPANQIMGLDPGEVFVHRNVANLVVHSDLNALSTIQFAVERLRVKEVMIVGHFGCSGVRTAMAGDLIGLADNWLRHIQNTRDEHAELLESVPAQHRADLLCELNVLAQVVNVARSTVVLDAWSGGQALEIHGWVYGLHDGLLRDLGLSVTGPVLLRQRHAQAVALAVDRWRAAETAAPARMLHETSRARP